MENIIDFLWDSDILNNLSYVFIYFFAFTSGFQWR